MNKSFTLIEILVVIVVIGILSAFILVGMSSITDSANITKSQTFANSLDSSLLLDRVSQWKFDELNTAIHGTTPVKDSWGNNNGTFYTNNGSVEKLLTSCPFGKCISFDGTDDYIHCGTGGNIGLSSITYSAWAKTSDSSGSRPIMSKDSSLLNWFGAMFYPFHYNGDNKALFYITTDIYVYSSTAVNDNKWHHIVGVCDRTKHISPDIYLDGKKNNGSFSGYCDEIGTIVDGGALRLGYETNTNQYFLGAIDDVRMYNQALSSSQAQQNYFLGLNNLYKNKGITFNEFNQRIVELRSNLVNQ